MSPAAFLDLRMTLADAGAAVSFGNVLTGLVGRV